MKKIIIIIILYSCTPASVKKDAPAVTPYILKDTISNDSLVKNNPYKVVPTQ